MYPDLDVSTLQVQHLVEKYLFICAGYDVKLILLLSEHERWTAAMFALSSTWMRLCQMESPLHGRMWSKVIHSICYPASSPIVSRSNLMRLHSPVDSTSNLIMIMTVKNILIRSGIPSCLISQLFSGIWIVSMTKFSPSTKVLYCIVLYWEVCLGWDLNQGPQWRRGSKTFCYTDIAHIFEFVLQFLRWSFSSSNPTENYLQHCITVRIRYIGLQAREFRLVVVGEVKRLDSILGTLHLNLSIQLLDPLFMISIWTTLKP